MCDTEVWENYTDAEGRAVWAMGGPTEELFANSYNASSLGYTIELEVNDYGYTNNMHDDWLSNVEKNGIYCCLDDDMWLASPSGAYDCIGRVSKQYMRVDYGYLVNSMNCRPIVCIPKSNFYYELAEE